MARVRKPAWRPAPIIVGMIRGTREKIKPSRDNWKCPVCGSKNPQTRGGDVSYGNRLGFCLACYTDRGVVKRTKGVAI